MGTTTWPTNPQDVPVRNEGTKFSQSLLGTGIMHFVFRVPLAPPVQIA